MLPVLLGVCGFVSAYLFEWPALRKLRFLRIVLAIAAFGLLSFSFFAAATASGTLHIPLTLSRVAWVPSAIFVLLFIFSTLVEIPLRRALQGGMSEIHVVSTGTYALTRHPGVIWALLALVSLTLATRSKTLFIATPVWMLMDLVWVWLEDRFYFVETIPGYREYKNNVPMLVPTSASIKKCLSTLKLYKEVDNR